MSITTAILRRSAVAVAVLAAAIVLVPSAARARQHIDQRDSTRLSIKHSWIGVAPPSKASPAPTQPAALPAPLLHADRIRGAIHVGLVRPSIIRTIGGEFLDPLRGPPSRRS